MTRKEAEERIIEKWGFLPYGGVALSLYEPDEEVPDHLVEYELRVGSGPSPGNFIVCSPQVANILNEIQDD